MAVLRREPETGSSGPVLAALDLGTNNCRLLVARPHGDAFDVLDSFSRIVRLGEGVAGSGRLTERAMARTVAALKVCARIMERHGVTHSRCVATEACRRAMNGVAFVNRVRRVTGLQFEIVPHEQEAELALLGCLPLVDPDAEQVLLVDIGGGSTEILWLDRSPAVGAQLRCVASVPIGVVSLSEAFTSEPDAATFAAMVERVSDLLAPIELAYGIGGATRGARAQMLGTSGTVTTLAAVLLELPRYDRRMIDGVTLDPAEIGVVCRRLRAMDNAARTAHPCIGPGRADLVVAGCAILEGLLRSWPVDSLRVADRGLREGMLHGLMGRTLEWALAPAPSMVGAKDRAPGRLLGHRAV
ncbi:MAG TPA: Ppx/GppA phosphatase family protein [Geminicoccaceae bacterium]|nr:Ppx/GppA phosphatase family protein [Geminicoccaceae bacterium]